MCIMWKEKIERINGPKNEKNTIILNVFPMFFFWVKNYFDVFW